MIKRLAGIIVILVSFCQISSLESIVQPRQEAENQLDLSLSPAGEAAPHDWIGPEGGLITAIAIDPRNPSSVFTGTWVGGVYKSTDAGATWNRSSQGLGNMRIVSLAIDPSDPAKLYAGTHRGRLYKSADSGATWQLASDGIQADAIVYSIAIDPQNTQRIYIATRGKSKNGSRPWAGVVYRSDDGGASWAPSLFNLGGPDYQDWAYALEINPNTPNVIFAATHEHGPVRSKDSGRTWKVLLNGVTNRSTRAIVVDPRLKFADTLYTAVWTKAGVFKSSDGGRTWQLKSAGLNGAQIYRMEIDPFRPQTIYAGTYNMGVIKTTNGAEKWSAAGLGWVGIASLAVSPVDGRVVFAGTDEDGLYVSRDGGRSWVHSQAGLTARSVTSLIVSPHDPSVYYAATDGGGVLRSQDRGLNWSMFNNNLSNRDIHALVKHPLENVLFALTRKAGLYRCDLDNIDTCWQETSLNAELAVQPAAVHRADPAAASHHTCSRVYESLLPTDRSLPPGRLAPLLTMAFAPFDANIVYVGTDSAGVYRSNDNGVTWTRTKWRDQTVESIAVHPLNPDLIYATTGRFETLGRSPDGGVTWQELKLPGVCVYAVVVPHAPPDRVLAGTDDGIFQRLEESWSQIGLAGETVTALGIHPQRSALYVAGTANGAWISLDAGQTWLPGPAELQGIPINSINFSDHDPELIFFNTMGNGTLRTGSVQASQDS